MRGTRMNTTTHGRKRQDGRRQRHRTAEINEERPRLVEGTTSPPHWWTRAFDTAPDRACVGRHARVMLARMDDADVDVDEDGLPTAPACPECGIPMEPETFTGANRIHVAFVCSTHGIGWTLDPFAK